MTIKDNDVIQTIVDIVVDKGGSHHLHLTLMYVY